MNHNTLARLIALSLIAAVLAACAPMQAPATPTEPVQSHGGPAMDYVSLVEALRAGGATVEPAGEIQQPFFSVAGRALTVDGAQVQVFEYASDQAAQEEAKQIAPDGASIGTTMVTWVATPHFYTAGRLIVLYVGDDPAVLKALEAVLG